MLEISQNVKTLTLVVFAFYVIVLFGIGWWAKRQNSKSSLDKFVDEFYTGGRGMGALVVGLMIGASVCSAGTFLGGPGLGTKAGLIWAVTIYATVIMNFVILGMIGKKIGIVARRINAVSYVALLKHRFNNNKIIGILGPLSLIVFLIPYCAAQFIGGARMFSLVTDLPYIYGLVIFSLIILIYAVFGGMRGVSMAIVFQGFVMTLAVLALLFGVIHHLNATQGGLENAFRSVVGTENQRVMTPLTWTFMTTFGLMFINGVTYVGLPHAVQATLTYKNTQSMHGAILVGMVFVTMWQGIMMFVGPASKLMGLNLQIADQTTPAVAMTVLPPWLAGVIIAGAVGAIQSTVASMLLILSSSLTRDLYVTYVDPKISNEKLKNVTYIFTALSLLAIFIFAANPPEFLQIIINFALGGMESAFWIPILFGMYWRRTTEQGAIVSMVSGLGYYLLCTPFPALAMGTNPLIPATFLSIASIIIVSLVTPQTPKGVIMTWFSTSYPKTVED